MGTPPTPAEPRTFPNDPNPPPVKLDVPSGASAPAAGSGGGISTSAGSGALPPSFTMEPAAGNAPVAPLAKTFRVVEQDNGSRDIYEADDQGARKVGEVDLPKEDADKILHATGKYDEKLHIWEGVPEETVKALGMGRPGFSTQLLQSLQGGEAGLVQSFNSLAFVQGKMSRADAEARNDESLLSTQLAPGSTGASFAHRGLGEYAAEVIKYPINAIRDAMKFSAKGIAEFAPTGAYVAKETMEGALEAAGPETLIAMATGTAELPPVAAGLVFLTAGGAIARGSKALIDIETGNVATGMMRQGYDDETIRTYAVLGGTVKGGLWALSAEFMTVPFKQKLLTSLAGSKAAQKLLAHWALRHTGEAAAGVTMTVAQEKIGQILNNMAAEGAKRPELLISGKESWDRLFAAALAGMGVAIPMGMAAAGMEKISAEKVPGQRGMTNPVPKEKPFPQEKPAAGAGKEVAPTPGEKPARKLSSGLQKRLKGMETLEAREPVNPFDSLERGTEKETAKNILETWSAKKNQDTVIGNQLREEGKRAVAPADREAVRWYIAANGDEKILKAAAEDPKFVDIKPDLERALSLPPKALAMAEKLANYYQQVGEASKANGTIREMRENYQNRIYAPEKGKVAPKIEGSSGLKTTSRHAKRAFYRTEFDAYAAGKRFQGDVFDAAAAYGADMARVNANRQIADAMVSQGLAAWSLTSDGPPDGWAKVGETTKFVALKNNDGTPYLDHHTGNQMHVVYHLTAPEGLAKALKPIVDPNFLKKVDALRGVEKYQGVVKTAELATSLYHDVTLLAQKFAERDFAGTWEALTPGIQDELLASPETKKLEQWGAGFGLMTSATARNVDIIPMNESIFAGVRDAPVIKQILDGVDAKTRYTFEKVQRLNKIYGFAKLMSEWVGDHPEATNEEVLTAGRQFAEHINSTYGGQNWEARGWTKSNLSLARLLTLAPDWLVSNTTVARNALGGGVKGSAARAQLLTAFGAAIALTEGANKLLTGHFTDENEEGHELEIEIEPGVHATLFRGPIGEIVKLVQLAMKHKEGENLAETAANKATGALDYAGNKGSPATREAALFLTRRDYYGRKLQGIGLLKAALAAALPIPFGVQNFAAYLDKEEPTITGGAAVSAGLAKFSKGKK